MYEAIGSIYRVDEQERRMSYPTIITLIGNLENQNQYPQANQIVFI